MIKEPHGSIAAPLLMAALPESRMVFMIRDPRDVVASRLDAHKMGGWTRNLTGKSGRRLADTDAFVRTAANAYLRVIMKVTEAYDAFNGRKVLVKYERLRVDAVEELQKIYAKLHIPVSPEQLQHVVGNDDWENIPDKKKGASKSRRKASPGSWSEALTSEQVTSGEQITAPLLVEFYDKQTGSYRLVLAYAWIEAFKSILRSPAIVASA